VSRIWRTFSVLLPFEDMPNEDRQLDMESQGSYVSENCLTLNVIRLSGYVGTPLPVGVVSIFPDQLSCMTAPDIHQRRTNACLRGPACMEV
jgi:hypothetical protein